MEKLKCYLAICGEYPKGIVFSPLNSGDPKKEAKASTKECRECGEKAYVRVKYFTKEDLEALPEID